MIYFKYTKDEELLKGTHLHRLIKMKFNKLILKYHPDKIKDKTNEADIKNANDIIVKIIEEYKSAINSIADYSSCEERYKAEKVLDKVFDKYKFSNEDENKVYDTICNTLVKTEYPDKSILKDVEKYDIIKVEPTVDLEELFGKIPFNKNDSFDTLVHIYKYLKNLHEKLVSEKYDLFLCDNYWNIGEPANVCSKISFCINKPFSYKPVIDIIDYRKKQFIQYIELAIDKIKNYIMES